MLTDSAHQFRLVVSRQLLAKSSQHFAHSGKHALYGNPPRWHLITPSKPAPKGAPIASNPGAIAAALYTMPAVQVAQIKLPDSNTNASSFNKQVDKLVGYAASGDAAAILGMSFGTNTYSKKAAVFANFLLQKMGVHEHVVAHGQSAGTHSALQVDAAAATAAVPDDVESTAATPIDQSVPVSDLAKPQVPQPLLDAVDAAPATST